MNLIYYIMHAGVLDSAELKERAFTDAVRKNTTEIVENTFLHCRDSIAAFYFQKGIKHDTLKNQTDTIYVRFPKYELIIYDQHDNEQEQQYRKIGLTVFNSEIFKKSGNQKWEKLHQKWWRNQSIPVSLRYELDKENNQDSSKKNNQNPLLQFLPLGYEYSSDFSCLEIPK